MLITKDTPPRPKKHVKPEFKWQVNEFARVQEFRFHLPYGFLLLCKLWNTPPDDLITDFIDTLAHGSWKREGRKNAIPHLQQYILEMAYGQNYYNVEDIQTMFRELDTIASLWPENAGTKMIEMHARWRDKYYNWWFKKWNKKYQRK